MSTCAVAKRSHTQKYHQYGDQQRSSWEMKEKKSKVVVLACLWVSSAATFTPNPLAGHRSEKMWRRSTCLHI